MLKTLSVVGFIALSGLASEGQQPLTDRSVSASLPDGQFVTMPSVTSQLMPTLAAGPSGITGNVDIETVVSAEGSVTHARVAKSPDSSGALDRACVDAVRQWRFEPATSNSRAVASLVLVRFSIARPSGNAGPVVNANLMTVDYSAPPQVWTPAVDTPVLAPGAGNNVRWPSVLREVRPRYTSEAMRAKIVGSVELEVVVGTDGRVVAARITKGLDAEHGLDNAALVAARYWLFNPGTRDGAPVPTRVGLVLEYRLH